MSAPNHVPYIGLNARESIHGIMTKIKVDVVFVVHGKRSFYESGASKLLAPFLENKQVYFFSDFTENPTLEQVEKLVLALQSAQPDLLMAVGGGSAMDIAKAGRALTYSKIDLIQALQTNQVADIFPCQLVAIPTTAGTGSEATHFSVIYHEQKKYALSAHALLPDYAVVDPAFSLNMPLYLRACTLMDALCQAIESFWAVQATKESQFYAEKAILLIKENAFVAMSESGWIEKAKMAEAAYYAGRAINISKTTAPHALSYWLTSQYRIPHGHAVALNIGRFLLGHDVLQKDAYGMPRMNGHLNIQAHQETMSRLYQMLGVSGGKAAYDWVVKFMKTLGLGVTWQDFKLDVRQIVPELIREVNLERMQNNPIQFDEQALQILLRTEV